MIGSSIFLVYDRQRSGAWMIDFAKTSRLPDGLTVDHRSPWQLGNREEGYLTGLDSLCKVRRGATRLFRCCGFVLGAPSTVRKFWRYLSYEV